MNAVFGGPSFRLFRVFGFPVGAHWSLPLALVVAGISYGGMAGVFLSALLFASVLAHELGHALIARRRGVPIAGIDLHFFGGVAKMAAPPRSPSDEVAIAIAGPIVSFGIAAVAGGAFALLHQPLLLWLAVSNFVLFAFNLVPALPLDGGRVLRALLAKRQGLVKGTRTAVAVSRVFAVAIVVVGAVVFHSWSFALLGALVWMMGSAELRQIAWHQYAQERGAWHGATTPWTRYDRAAEAERRERGEPLTPDAIIEPVATSSRW